MAVTEHAVALTDHEAAHEAVEGAAWGYCWWCGDWRELPFFNAICRTCHETKRTGGRDRHIDIWQTIDDRHQID
jgi:hypothetical protein